MSIVSFLWQYQTVDIVIPTTIIKNQQQIPHHYFYSHKQKRVLRKKNPECISLLQSLRSNILLLQISRTIQKKERSLSINMVDASSSIENLRQKDFEGQFTVIQSGFQIFRYAEIFKNFHKEKDIEILLSEQSHSQKTLKQLKENQKLSKFIESIRSKFVQIWEKSNSTLKKNISYHDKNSVKSMEIILGVKQEEIILVEVIRVDFQIEMENLFSIKNKPAQSKLLIKSQQVNQKSIEKPQKIQQTKEMLQVKEQKFEKNTFVKCACCQSDTHAAQLKQVHNQDLKRIRREAGKAIRGLSQEYYQVCSECYQNA